MSEAAPVETTEQPKERLNLGQMVRRIVQGDLSSVRVVFGLILIAIIFQVQEDRFLSAENLTNLMLQITTIGLISVGVVGVLLLGEIDLSVGAVSGLAGAVMAVLNVKHGWNAYLAIAAAGFDEGAALGSLDQLVSHELVRETDVPRRFAFRHPLVRAAVYQAASPGTRLEAHARSARLLSGRSAPPQVLAHHVEHAARPGDADAIRVLTDAATWAASHAPASAVRWRRSALRLRTAARQHQHSPQTWRVILQT